MNLPISEAYIKAKLDGTFREYDQSREMYRTVDKDKDWYPKSFKFEKTAPKNYPDQACFDEIRRLVMAGEKSVTITYHIAEMFNISVNRAEHAIGMIRREIRGPRMGEIKPHLPWADSDTKRLLKYVASGYTEPKIGEAFRGRFSRSAIAAKIRRLRIEGVIPFERKAA